MPRQPKAFNRWRVDQIAGAVGEFVEVESGKKSDRPELDATQDKPTGSGDGLIDLMCRYNITITRQNCLELAYMGNKRVLTAEARQRIATTERF